MTPEVTAPNTATLPRRRTATRDRVEDIIDIAEQQIRDGGLLNLSMHKIGSQLSASRTMIYTYFRDDNALARAVFRRQVDWLLNRGLLTAAREGGFYERATTCACMYLDHIVEHGPIIHYVLRDRREMDLEPGLTLPLMLVLRTLASAAEFDLALTRTEALALIVMLSAVPEELARMVTAGDLSHDQATAMCASLLRDSFDSLQIVPQDDSEESLPPSDVLPPSPMVRHSA